MESAFRDNLPADFALIETLGYHPSCGLAYADLHLNRMCQSARALGIPFDHREASVALARITGDTALRCRLTVDRMGKYDLVVVPIKPVAREWRIGISRVVLRSDDPWLRHKSTQRAVYDRARAELPDGIDEVIFFNEKGELCEGTITNVFVQDPDGTWRTPPLSSGCLPGILRQVKISTGHVRAGVITRDDLRTAKRMIVGNALRGEINARLCSYTS